MNLVITDELAPTIATHHASSFERRLAYSLIVVLCAATALAFGFRNASPAVVPAFIPTLVGATGMADFLAAVLLYTLYRTDGERFVLILASVYLANALLAVPYGLTFPGVIDDRGFLGNLQSAAWVWIVWHCMFAVAMLAGSRPTRPIAAERRAAVMVRAIAGVVVASAIVAVVVTLGRDLLPAMTVSGGLAGRRFTALFRGASVAVAVLSAIALAALFRTSNRSSIGLWTIVALTASGLDAALNGISSSRYSGAWYVGKIEQFVTATTLLTALLAAWSAVNARATALARELAATLSERRLLEVDLAREQRASEAFQRAALPRTLPTLAGITFAAVYRAASDEAVVGGDWYDAFRIDDGRIVVSVGDVMGNGLDAAVTMNAVRQAIRGAAQLLPEPLAIVDAADRALRSEFADAIVTAFVAVLDPVTLTLASASAGHPPALLRHADGRVEAVGHAPGLPLGLRGTTRDDSALATALRLPDPSLLVFYTDGLTEASRNIVAGEARLREVIADPAVAASGDPAVAIAECFLGNAHDDIAVLTVRLHGVLQAALGAGGGLQRWIFDPADGAKAGEIRRALAQTLVAVGANDDEIILSELIYSELVGNVLRHAPPREPAEVVLDVSTDLPVLHVRDRGPGFAFAARLPSAMMSESGRGLYIVSQLAHDLSVTRRKGGGSHARAVLPIRTLVAGGANQGP